MCDQMSSAHTLRIFVSTTVGWRHIPSLMTENCIFKLKKEADIQQLTLCLVVLEVWSLKYKSYTWSPLTQSQVVRHIND